MRDARAIADETARAAYGRLIAILSARTGDIAAAEDALSDAFAAALETWPERGVPDAPDAWLLTAARRRLIDNARRVKTRSEAVPALILVMEEVEARAAGETFIDERLKLLFVCAHPAIDESVRTPLMLQTVLGLDAARIGSAFLTAPTAMSQRLVRAKKKIAAASIPFETPGPEDLHERAGAVLDSIYAAFGAGYDGADGSDPRSAGLSEEAIYLGRLVAALMPDNAEAHGLLALMLYSHSRRAARRVADKYIPLDEQDVGLWDRALIAEAEGILGRACALKAPGRFQLEAAIQSAHAARRLKGVDTNDVIINLYKRLSVIAPSTGADVASAAALLKAGRTEEALERLSDISAGHAARYQPYWATRAHVLAVLGDNEGARASYFRAIGLSEEEAVRKFLRVKMAALEIQRGRRTR